MTRGNMRCGIVAIVLAIVACECQGPIPDVDPPTADCDYADPVVLPSDACDDGLVLRAVRFDRVPGPPSELDEPLVIPADGELCVRVHVEDLSAAWVEVADEAIVLPRDLHGEPVSRTQRIAVSAGIEALRLRVASMPGGTLDVEVRFAPSEPSARTVEAAEDFAALNRTLCNEYNLNVEAILDPVVAAAFLESHAVAGVTPGRIVILRNGYGGLRSCRSRAFRSAVPGSSRSTTSARLARSAWHLGRPAA